MEGKKSPKGRKRTAKGTPVPAAVPDPIIDDHFWDCSVCTYRNNAEAFKCSMCDVRKGTSTRKPRLNLDLVASQQAQALTPPPPSTTPTPSSSNSVQLSGDEGSTSIANASEDHDTPPPPPSNGKAAKKVKEPKTTKKKEPGPKKTPANTIPRLKNVDRKSATYHSVTVNDFTVVITEFVPKVKKEKKPKVMKDKNPPGTPADEDSSRTSKSESASRDGADNRSNGHSTDTTTGV